MPFAYSFAKEKVVTINNTQQIYNSIANQHTQQNSTASSNFTAMIEKAAKKLLASMDSNGNGSVSEAEFSKAMGQVSNSSSTQIDKAFDAMDTNKNGSLSSSELLQALQQMAKMEQTKHTNTSTYEQNAIASNKGTSGGARTAILQDLLSAYGGSVTA
jgi:Ca2+-binding EF-hand superfamily protein